MYNISDLNLDTLSIPDFNDDWEWVNVPAPYFIRDGFLYLSAESEATVADYYGEFSAGYPWVSPFIEKWAKEHGGYWEWVNPGCLMFVK